MFQRDGAQVLQNEVEMHVCPAIFARQDVRLFGVLADNGNRDAKGLIPFAWSGRWWWWLQGRAGCVGGRGAGATFDGWTDATVTPRGHHGTCGVSVLVVEVVERGFEKDDAFADLLEPVPRFVPVEQNDGQGVWYCL